MRMLKKMVDDQVEEGQRKPMSQKELNDMYLKCTNTEEEIVKKVQIEKPVYFSKKVIIVSFHNTYLL
jgi:hypothetical protein